MNKTIIGLAFALISSAAVAEEPVCMPKEELEAALTDWYGETPMPGVVATTTSTMQLWTSRSSETWTLVKYLIDGSACAISSGKNLDRASTAEATIAALIAK